MKTFTKILIAAIVGLAAMLLCYQIFHLDLTKTIIAAIIVAASAFLTCGKLKPQK